MSLQTSIPRTPGKWGARFSGHWVATSMFVLKLLSRGHQRSNWRKPRIKEISTWINICPTNPIKVWKLRGIFWRFCLCPSNKWKTIDVGTGTPWERQGVFERWSKHRWSQTKQRLSSIHSLRHLSRLCGNYTWTFSTPYSTEGLPYWGFQRYAFLSTWLRIHAGIKVNPR